MPIHRLLDAQSFGPDDIRALSVAFEDTLKELGLIDRADPLVQIVAERIVELGRQGVRDPVRLPSMAVGSLK
jgi:hypothetical protein